MSVTDDHPIPLADGGSSDGPFVVGLADDRAGTIGRSPAEGS